jgi:hypothetical protein
MRDYSIPAGGFPYPVLPVVWCLSIDPVQYLDHMDLVERFPHPGESTVSILKNSLFDSALVIDCLFGPH